MTNQGTTKPIHRFAALPLLLTFAACESNQPQVTLRDGRGNYVTTAEFEAMERTEFVAAIRAGIQDYDEQMGQLRDRANELGGDSLEQFAECEPALREQRESVINQLGIAEGALNDRWPEEREETVEAYVELREDLTEAQESVLDR